MASLKCPHCGAPLRDQRTWAEAALSTTIAAPAVPDMATQRRCDHCGRVSAASDIRPAVADRFKRSHQLLWMVVAALMAWGLVWLFAR